MHGIGKMKYSTGEVREGQWENGVFVKALKVL